MVAIFVIVTFVGFILADAAVQWTEARRREKGVAPGRSPALGLGRVTIPRGLFAAPGHTWLALEPAGRARIGMDNLAVRAIGRIDSLDLPAEGREVRMGDPLFTVRQGDRSATFVSPVDGVVTGVNRELARDPAPVEADPYRHGWICALTPARLAEQIRGLKVAEEAREWLRREAERFAAVFSARPMKDAVLGELMQDGGTLATGLLQCLDEESWGLFEREFLRPSAGKETA